MRDDAQEKPQVLNAIASASQASNNLVNAIMVRSISILLNGCMLLNFSVSAREGQSANKYSCPGMPGCSPRYSEGYREVHPGTSAAIRLHTANIHYFLTLFTLVAGRERRDHRNTHRSQ